MSILQIRPSDVHSYIHDVELPSRRLGTLGNYAEEILRSGGFIGSEVECHSQLTRAMDRAREHIDGAELHGQSVKSGRVILARRLTGSKGRFTRTWHAPEGGLWGCLVHANTLSPQSALLLSLGVGVAACEAILECGIDDVAIRWVNDVLLKGEKVAGFLIESHMGTISREQFHLIGFGINVNNRDFPEDLRDIATSLIEHTGGTMDLHKFCLNFIAKLTWNIGLLYFAESREYDSQVIRTPEEHPLLQRWQELTDSIGKSVTFGYDVITRPQYRAKVMGVVPDGGLQLLLDDGNTMIEHSGEIRYL